MAWQNNRQVQSIDNHKKYDKVEQHQITTNNSILYEKDC